MQCVDCTHLNRSTPSSLPLRAPSIAPSKLKKLEGDKGCPASMKDCMAGESEGCVGRVSVLRVSVVSYKSSKSS